MQTDEQLVKASLAGSDSAFSELVIRYRERLFRFLLTRAATREDAEDALQDTLIGAYRYLHSFNARWRFSTWIYRIALRNLARQQPKHQAAAVDVDRIAVHTDDPLQQCLAASEQSNIWLTARHLLADDAYSAMWLRYVEDLPVRDVARALDKSLSWAKITLMRGRRRLQAELSESTPARRTSYG